MKKIYLLIIATFALTPAASAWSGAIHTGITAIAEANLTPEAKRNISDALADADGTRHSLAYFAYWLDDVADSPKYAAAKEWVNVAVTDKNQIINAKKRAKSPVDAIRTAGAFDGLAASVEALKHREKLTKEEVADHIRIIVYVLADLHCPAHYVYADMPQVRDWTYVYNKKSYNYVAFWNETAITGTYSNWRANEYVHQLNRKSPEQVKALTEGSLASWVESNAAQYRWIYTIITPGQEFDSKQMRLWQNKVYPVSTDLAAVAGYRIAHVLNSLFDGAKSEVKVK